MGSYYNFAPTAVDRQIRKGLSQNKPFDSCCASLPLDASSFKGGYPPTANLLVGSAVREESVTYVKPAFLSQVYLKPTSRNVVKICHNIFE
jgi:hypothetical protein